MSADDDNQLLPLLRLLEEVHSGFRDALSARLTEAGYGDIRVAHSCVFGNIEAEGSRLTDLAERARLTKQAVGEIVTDLESLGYLERVPDPSDGRAKIIRLTARGQGALTFGRAAVAEIEAVWAHRYGASEVASLRQVLQGIRSDLFGDALSGG